MPNKLTALRTRRRSRAPRQIPFVYQFLVVLANTDPLVWRRLQVPGEYSFWDLHVAIQDAMGWLDYHLHEFSVLHPKRGRFERLGIPDEEFPDERPCRPDWRVQLSDYFEFGAQPALYVYDFGDNWHHIVTYEETLPVDPSVSYPRCVSGARKGPPEDCGGVHGYADFLKAIADKDHPEHSELLQWVGGAYDPEAFDPARVVFDDPTERWKKAFHE